MAVNLPKHGTWDPLTSTRAPIRGDTQLQYDIATDTYRTAVYDGSMWREFNNNATSAISPNITASSIGTIPSPSGSYTTVSTAANAWKNDLYEMFAENVRVAEYVDESGKIDKVQLEWREGPRSVWEPIQRVRIKL